MAAISLHGVRRVHPDGTAALAGVDLDVADGEVVGVLGPSGSGKSTLLRVVAGLDPLTDGLVRIDGVDVAGASVRTRNLAYVAQARSLNAFMDVASNLAFPLELRGIDPAEADRRARAEARSFGISRLWRHRPRQLSAGGAQRTALARAMVRLPRALLADEPLQLLDPPTAARLREEVRRLQRATAMTTIWTSNDHPQVLGIADRVAVLRAGRLVQVGRPQELLDRPRTSWVAGFVGDPPRSLVQARVADEGGLGYLDVGDQRLRVAGGLPGPLRDLVGRRVVVGLRSDAVRPARAEDDVERRLHGRVVDSQHLGHVQVVTVQVGPQDRLLASFPPPLRVVPGARVELHVDLDRIAAFDAERGTAVWHGRPHWA